MDNRNDLLVHISELYYQQNLNQSEIAKILGVSRPTVSRLLDEARETGIVEIIVHNPIRKNPALSVKLRNTFQLREAVVVSGNYNHDTALTQCAEVAAKFVSTILDNNMSIGFSWGRAINAICDAIKPKDYYNVNVIQMAGCLGTGNPHIDGLELALKVAKKFNGTYANIIAPVYVDNQIVRDHLISSPQIKSTIKKACEVDIALTGIGTLTDPQGSLNLAGCYTEAEIRQLLQLGVTGHILARFINRHGNEIFLENHYPISAPLEAMRNAEWAIGVCVSADKAEAVLSVINGKYINCLIVDEALAQKLLEIA